MKATKNILSTLLILLSIFSSGQAQQLPTVCPGQNNVRYTVAGSTGSSFVWSIPREADLVYESAKGDTIELNWSNRAGIYTLEVYEQTVSGCSGDNMTARVLVATNIDIFLEDQINLCQGEIYTFEPGDFETYLWHNGSEANIYATGKTELVTLTAFADNGCYYTDEVDVQVHEHPIVDLGNDTTLCGEQEYILDAGTDENGLDYTSYEWSTDEISREIIVSSGLKEIKVKVYDQYGCTGKDSVLIKLCDIAKLFKENTPNTITPGNDGLNDTWKIPNIEFFPDAKIEIFNRWGIMVYTNQEQYYGHEWDGTDLKGNELPTDSYFYIVDLKVKGVKPINGTITVVR